MSFTPTPTWSQKLGKHNSLQCSTIEGGGAHGAYPQKLSCPGCTPNFEWNQEKWVFSCTEWPKVMTFQGLAHWNISCSPSLLKFWCWRHRWLFVFVTSILMLVPPLALCLCYVYFDAGATTGSLSSLRLFWCWCNHWLFVLYVYFDAGATTGSLSLSRLCVTESSTFFDHFETN